MRFAVPALLYLLPLAPLYLVAVFLLAARRRKEMERFAGGRERVDRFAAQVSPHRRAARAILLALAIGAGILAAARPQWGTRLEPVTRRGVDVVVAVDTSLSMAARDVSPDRLGQARHAAASLLRRLAGNRVGLVTFAGQATLACPLTLDVDAASLFLDAVDVESVAVKGTAIADALRVAVRAFGTEAPSGQERSRAIVLFSDGEDHEGGIEDALALLRKGETRVFSVGCGTRQGSPIPLGGDGGSAGYKKDREDRLVTTRLDDTILGKLAVETGGRYFDATPAELEVEGIAEEIGAMEAREFGTVMRARYEERFQIPLGLAAAALAADALLGDRRRRVPSRARGEAS